MPSFPRFRLYESDGSTLVYEFDCVTNWDNAPFQDPKSFVEHQGLRGQGSIIIEGSDSPWDFNLQFFLTGTDYEDLVAKMEGITTTINFNTKYILKIDLTSGGSTKDLKVKRLSSINYPTPTGTTRKVTTGQSGNLSFRVNSWS